MVKKRIGEAITNQPTNRIRLLRAPSPEKKKKETGEKLGDRRKIFSWGTEPERRSWSASPLPVAQGSTPMQRWYQPCMQQPKPRKETFSGCGEAADFARAPTIHKRGLVVFTERRRGGGRSGVAFASRRATAVAAAARGEETEETRWVRSEESCDEPTGGRRNISGAARGGLGVSRGHGGDLGRWWMGRTVEARLGVVRDYPGTAGFPFFYRRACLLGRVTLWFPFCSPGALRWDLHGLCGSCLGATEKLPRFRNVRHCPFSAPL